MYKALCLLSLIFTNVLYPAKIAMFCMKEYPGSTTVLFYQEIMEEIRKSGHIIEFYICNNLNERDLVKYDLILSIMGTRFPKKINEKTILYLYEPPIIAPLFSDSGFLNEFHKVFTWDHDICDQKKFIKGYYCAYAGIHKEFKPFINRKLACLINSYLGPFGLYKNRMEIAKFYNTYFPKSLTLYGGRGWKEQNIGIYKGICDDKHKVLRNHKFCYCYENWDNNKHYISEKIQDCLMSRCVPIYLGSSRITDYIPKEAFIDARNFKSIDEMHRFISQMDEKTWLTYIDAIETWDKSENSLLFRKNFHVKYVSDEVLKSLKAKGLH